MLSRLSWLATLTRFNALKSPSTSATLNEPSHFVNHPLPIISLTLVATLTIVGCQKPAEPTPETSANTIAPAISAPTTPAQIAPNPNTAAKPPVATQSIEQPITILALGDSLTEGLGLPENEAYPAQLEQALKDAGYVNAKVVNSGLSGETSSGLVNRLNWALKTKPDITILTIGANDAMRGIDVATIEKNIRTAIERLQSEGSIVVLGGMQIYDNLGNDYVKTFSDIYPKLAKDYNIAFIPFFLEGVGGVAELNQADAIHPTKEGYNRIVNNNILPVLKPTLEQFVAHKQTSANETAQ